GFRDLLARRQHTAGFHDRLTTSLGFVEAGGELPLDEQLDVVRELLERLAIELGRTYELNQAPQQSVHRATPHPRAGRGSSQRPSVPRLAAPSRGTVSLQATVCSNVRGDCC